MAQQAAAAVTLASFPDDAFLLVVAACGDTEDGVPLLEAVKGLGGLCKGIQQQLCRLRPLVGVRSLAGVQRPAHVPWHVVLLYTGVPTMAVVDQARQGRVRSIVAMHGPQPRVTTLAPAVARRVVPCLLGAGCSLIKLEMWQARLNNTWAATFGEAAVCSAVLRELTLFECGLRGPLPELRLPALLRLCVTASNCSLSSEPNQLAGSLEPLRGCTALQVLCLSNNQLTGGLKPLERCTALKVLALHNNQLTGDLEPLKSCTALQELCLKNNQLTGGLEPLRSCTALQELSLNNNQLTGGLEPLRSCTALQELSLNNNQLTGGLEPLKSCTALQILHLDTNQLTGDLEPLRGCTALEELSLNNNQLTGDLEPLRSCTALQELSLNNNQLTGDLEPLRSCTALGRLWLSGNHLTGGLEPLRGCTALEIISLCDNQLTGGLGPLQCCTALELLELKNNQLVPSDEDKAHFEKQCGWEEEEEDVYSD